MRELSHRICLYWYPSVFCELLLLWVVCVCLLDRELPCMRKRAMSYISFYFTNMSFTWCAPNNINWWAGFSLPLHTHSALFVFICLVCKCRDLRGKQPTYKTCPVLPPLSSCRVLNNSNSRRLMFLKSKIGTIIHTPRRVY